MHRKIGPGALIFAIVAAGLTRVSAAEISYSKLIDERSPALVTVKFVLKLKSPMGEQESETEITALMIEAKGLVLCSNAQLSGFTSVAGGGGITATPTDIKVLVGDDTEGVSAKLLARDTELDLAWVQIEKTPDKPYVFIDLAGAAEAKIGDSLVALRRMNKYYDRVPVVGAGNVGGIAKKPRTLYVASGPLATGPGQIVFAADGKPVGMTVVQLPGDDDEAELDMISRLSIARLLSEMILPAADIVKATEKAKANPITETEAKAAEEGEKKPDASGAAPAEEKP